MAIPHDRLFKDLIGTFFWEFLELFVPRLVPHLDRHSLVFLDKELFSDVTAGQSHEVDLVARYSFRGQDTCFLVHVESQAQYQSDFAARMFRYFARLHENHGLPVYPIALFSYPTVLRPPEPDRYRVKFPHRRVLDFRFQTIEVTRLDWRRFLRKASPVSSALMARMAIAPEDRPRVKAACLRMMTGLQLDEARRKLISVFIDAYLQLDEKENTRFMQELNTLKPAEQEAIMEYTTSWKEEGRAEGHVQGLQQGLQQGLAEGLSTAILARFGPSAAGLAERCASATVDQLEALKGRLLTANSTQELELLLEPTR